MLGELRARGSILTVLTNKPGDFSRRILDGLGLLAHFARVLGGDDGPPRKPDPAGVLVLIREAGASPATTLLVGDSPVDVATARNAGTIACGVTWGFAGRGWLAHDPPDFVVDDPVEILQIRSGI
jgi:phosphoglycolate phosphatase